MIFVWHFKASWWPFQIKSKLRQRFVIFVLFYHGQYARYYMYVSTWVIWEIKWLKKFEKIDQKGENVT